MARRLSKLDDQRQKMVSIDYALGSNACRCTDPFTFELNISRDVILEGSKGSNWDSKNTDDKGGEIKFHLGLI